MQRMLWRVTGLIRSRRRERKSCLWWWTRGVGARQSRWTGDAIGCGELLVAAERSVSKKGKLVEDYPSLGQTIIASTREQAYRI